MDKRFKDLIDELHAKYEVLMAMSPVTVDTAPRDTPKGGVYLFSDEGYHLYVGRTKRTIRDRLKEHVGTAKDCPLALHLARQATGNMRATYQPHGSREDLLTQAEFQQAYREAKERIRRMEVRYVREEHPLRQALLEIYVAVATEAKHNDFDTH